VASTKAVKTDLRKHALTFADTKEDHPWGQNVTKVKGKVFVFFGPEDDTSEGLMGVKLMKEWIAESYEAIAKNLVRRMRRERRRALRELVDRLTDAVRCRSGTWASAARPTRTDQNTPAKQ
jgi:predicted DNA-binding protein (MmcQ/YjbR family)